MADMAVACSATVKQALLNGKDVPFSRKDDAVRIVGSKSFGWATPPPADSR
jgi:hypothetical protein